MVNEWKRMKNVKVMDFQTFQINILQTVLLTIIVFLDIIHSFAFI
jgi:hypothetical protein